MFYTLFSNKYRHIGRTFFLIALIMLQMFSVVRANAVIPSSVIFDITPNTITPNTTIEMVLSGRDVSTLRGMQYSAYACYAGSLETGQQNCIPTLAGTENLSESLGYEFIDNAIVSSARLRVAASELLGATPGFYKIKISLNGVESIARTFQLNTAAPSSVTFTAFQPIATNNVRAEEPVRVIVFGQGIQSIRNMDITSYVCYNGRPTQGPVNNCDPKSSSGRATFNERINEQFGYEDIRDQTPGLDAFASKQFQPTLLLGIEPGFYNIILSINGIESSTRSFQLTRETTPLPPGAGTGGLLSFDLSALNQDILMLNTVNVNLVNFVSGGTAPFNFNIVSENGPRPDQLWCSLTDSQLSCTARSTGTARVTVRASDNAGNEATSSFTLNSVDISMPSQPSVPTAANQAPVANAGPDRTVNIGQVINFDSSGSSDPDGSIVSFSWNFGDGTSASGSTASHSYNSAGTFTVTLTVVDNNGASVADTAVINVLVNNPPVVSISADRSTGIAQVTQIRFTSVASDPNNDPLTFSWNFNDGTTSSEQNPVHVFNSAGTFTVTLTVADNRGAGASASLMISIRSRDQGSAPTVFISATPTTGRKPLRVMFTANAFDADGTIASYLWNFNDGTTSSEQNPVHVFNNTGTFRVTLVVTDNDGLTNTNQVSVSVSDRKEKEARKENLQISPITVGDSFLPGDRFEAYVKLRNSDIFDIEDMQVIVIVPDLGINEIVTNNIELETNSVRWLAIEFDIPRDAAAGEYIVKLLINTKDFDTFKYLAFEVL